MNDYRPDSLPVKDRFGDDLMTTAIASTKAADKATLILAWCRGIRHILTPLAWVAVSGFAYLTVRLVLSAALI